MTTIGLNTTKKYVSVYKVTRAYGGAEEGGWYYTIGEPVDGIYTLCCDKYPHTEGCPAEAVRQSFERHYVLGHREEFLESYTTANGTWSPDSMDDAPEDYRGEVATTGNYEVRVESEPPQPYPQETPHYE